MTTSVQLAPSVHDVPGLDPAASCLPLPQRSRGGLPQVVLPSGHTAIHLTRYADVRQALASPALSRRRANSDQGPAFLPTALPPEMLINLDGPDHSRIRRLVSPDFAAHAVTGLSPDLRAVIDRQLAVLRDSSRPDLYEDLFAPVTHHVTCRFLGVAADELSTFRDAFRTVQMGRTEDLAGLAQDFSRVYGYAADLAAGRRPCAPDGLLSRLRAGRDRPEPGLTDDELTVLFLTLLVSVDQNVLSLLTKAGYALLGAPPLWHRAAADAAVVPRLTEELIRLIPLGGAVGFPRVARTDLSVGSGTVFEGEIVWADAFTANRDPEVYEDPLVFDVDRVAKPHLQFGHGMHHCLGAALARLEITEIVTRLSQGFPSLAPAAPLASLPWDEGVLLRRPTRLPVRW